MIILLIVVIDCMRDKYLFVVICWWPKQTPLKPNLGLLLRRDRTPSLKMTMSMINFSPLNPLVNQQHPPSLLNKLLVKKTVRSHQQINSNCGSHSEKLKLSIAESKMIHSKYIMITGSSLKIKISSTSTEAFKLPNPSQALFIKLDLKLKLRIHYSTCESDTEQVISHHWTSIKSLCIPKRSGV